MTHIALVGCAHIHVPDLAKRLLARTRTVRVKWVWDPNRARARKRAAELSTQAVRTVEAIWADPEVKAVVIASETDRHPELVEAATEAGKHLFVEKPLGLGAADSVRMARMIEGSGVIFQTSYAMRGEAIARFLQNQLKDGAFGRVTRVRVTAAHAGALEDKFGTEWRWMTDPKRAGFGAYGDLGIHALDLLMWLFGEVTEVTAALARPLKRYGSSCDELGEGLLRFRSGVLASLAASWVDVGNPVALAVSGTEGFAYVCEGRLYFKSRRVKGADGKAAWSGLPPALPHPLELFLDALDGKDVPLVTPREAAERSAVMEALYQAAHAGKWVRVPALRLAG